MVWFKELVSKINLYPLKFKKCVNPQGPITRLETHRLPNGRYESYAFLGDKKTNAKPITGLYGNCDGTGTSKNIWIAQSKAISEALERWAFEERRYYWADKIPTSIHSTGFAAFPGIVAFKARENAFSEALERFILSQIALYKIPFSEIDPQNSSGDLISAKIFLPEFKRVFLIVQKKIVGPKYSFYSYGFACDKTRLKANQRAMDELERNAHQLSKFLNSKSTTLDVFEKRILYFATQKEGLIDSYTQIPISRLEPIRIPPRLCIDEEVKGEWSKFARVWRCFYALPSECLCERSDLFWF